MQISGCKYSKNGMYCACRLQRNQVVAKLAAHCKKGIAPALGKCGGYLQDGLLALLCKQVKNCTAGYKNVVANVVRQVHRNVLAFVLAF